GSRWAADVCQKEGSGKPGQSFVGGAWKGLGQYWVRPLRIWSGAALPAKRLSERTHALGLELRSTTPSPACCTTCHGHARARSGGRKRATLVSSCTLSRASLLEREA